MLSRRLRSGKPLVLLSGAVFAVFAWAASGAFAERAHAANTCRFGLHAAALNDPTGTELSLQIRPSAQSCPLPARLRSVRIKVSSPTGRLRSVRALKSVPSPQGTATVSLKGLVRRERLRITLSFRNLRALAIVHRTSVWRSRTACSISRGTARSTSNSKSSKAKSPLLGPVSVKCRAAISKAAACSG